MAGWRAGSSLGSGALAFSAARRTVSARFWAHCGCSPDCEYEAVPQIGHFLRSTVVTSGMGFRVFKLIALAFPKDRLGVGLGLRVRVADHIHIRDRRSKSTHAVGVGFDFVVRHTLTDGAKKTDVVDPAGSQPRRLLMLSSCCR